MMMNAFLGINAGSVLLPVCVMPGRTALCLHRSFRPLFPPGTTF